jgi:DNA-binding NarL/FixJ family response regulator
MTTIVQTRILIVDDNAVVRQQLRSLLDLRPEWQVCGEAVDGRDAVQKAKELHPDLIVLDFAMPVMNGLQTAQEIEKTIPHVPILLFTMFLSNQLVDEARNSGIRGAVAKANVGRDLVPGIEALLREETFFPTTQYESQHSST